MSLVGLLTRHLLNPGGASRHLLCTGWIQEATSTHVLLSHWTAIWSQADFCLGRVPLSEGVSELDRAQKSLSCSQR